MTNDKQREIMESEDKRVLEEQEMEQVAGGLKRPIVGPGQGLPPFPRRREEKKDDEKGGGGGGSW